jgi:hypothetical protein
MIATSVESDFTLFPHGSPAWSKVRAAQTFLKAMLRLTIAMFLDGNN